MLLPSDQVKRFYALWMGILNFVNHERGLLPEVREWSETQPLPPERVSVLRNALWQDDGLRESFLDQNPCGLSGGDLAIVRSWDQRVSGSFYVVKHLKKFSVFLDSKASRAFGVVGLNSSIAELVPMLPSMVNAVLLPFEGKIIYDSMLSTYSISFGPGLRRRLQQEYQEVKRNGRLILSLLPEERNLVKAKSRLLAER